MKLVSLKLEIWRFEIVKFETGTVNLETWNCETWKFTSWNLENWNFQTEILKSELFKFETLRKLQENKAKSPKNLIFNGTCTWSFKGFAFLAVDSSVQKSNFLVFAPCHLKGCLSWQWTALSKNLIFMVPAPGHLNGFASPGSGQQCPKISFFMVFAPLWSHYFVLKLTFCE